MGGVRVRGVPCECGVPQSIHAYFLVVGIVVRLVRASV